jgi:large subunit ribosomal protein L7e
MHRRKRATEKRTKIAIPQASVKNTVGFVVRIHAGRHTAPEIKTELRKLGLLKKYEGVFMNLNQENIGNVETYSSLSSFFIARLKPLDAYVAYGYIPSRQVHELLHRRAYTKQNGVKQILSNNLLIEQLLGSRNILCLNDLVHEIYTVGSAFDDALSILSPFQLSSPVGVFEKKVLEIHDEVEGKGGGFLDGNGMEVFLNKIL